MSKGIDPATGPRRPKVSAFAGLAAFIVVCGLLAPQMMSSAAPDASARKSSETAPRELPSFGSLLVKWTAGTAIILGLCAGVTYAIAKRAKARPAQSEGPIRVLGSMPVGRGMVYVVQAGSQKLLAGVDATGLKSLIPLAPRVEPLDEEPPAELPVVIARRVQLVTE